MADVFLPLDRGALLPSLFSKGLASLPAFPNIGILGQCHMQKIFGRLFWFVGGFFSKAQAAECETANLVKVQDKCIFLL